MEESKGVRRGVRPSCLLCELLRVAELRWALNGWAVAAISTLWPVMASVAE